MVVLPTTRLTNPNLSPDPPVSSNATATLNSTRSPALRPVEDTVNAYPAEAVVNAWADVPQRSDPLTVPSEAIFQASRSIVLDTLGDTSTCPVRVMVIVEDGTKDGGTCQINERYFVAEVLLTAGVLSLNLDPEPV
jgi:hypothetical protein